MPTYNETCTLALTGGLSVAETLDALAAATLAVTPAVTAAHSWDISVALGAVSPAVAAAHSWDLGATLAASAALTVSPAGSIFNPVAVIDVNPVVSGVAIGTFDLGATIDLNPALAANGLLTAVSNVTPVDTEVNVPRWQRVTCEIVDRLSVDKSLVEIKVNGVSYTQANGGLEFWQTTDIVGGSIVADLTDVWVGTTDDGWLTYGGEQDVALEVWYDSVRYIDYTFDAITTVGAHDNTSNNKARGWVRANSLEFSSVPSTAKTGGSVLGGYRGGTARTEGLVSQLWYGQVDAYGYVATTIRQLHLGSVIVAEGHEEHNMGSVIVQGFAREHHLGSVIVQGWAREHNMGSVIPATEHKVQALGSLIVAQQVLEHNMGSVIVRGVFEGPVIEIEVEDAATLAALLDMGFTFS